MTKKPFNYLSVALALMIAALVVAVAALILEVANCDHPTVAENATTEYVTFSEQIQFRLFEAGYLDESEIDGKIGPKTREAIKRYDERLLCDQYARQAFAKESPK